MARDLDKIHKILSDLKQIASHHGVVPTRDFYRQHGKFTDKDIAKHFPTFGEALKAAGISEKKLDDGKSKINFDSIATELLSHANIVKPKPIYTEGKTVLVIGDTHFPFCTPDQIEAAIQYAKLIKPDYIVQLGDLYDFYAQSKFPRSRNCYNPYEEVALGRAMAERFWSGLIQASPKSKCYQLLGNHDERPHKRVLEAYPDGEVFFGFKNLFKFSGVETIFDIRAELEIMGVLYFHIRRAFGTNVPYFGKPCVFGHTHREQGKWFNFGNRNLFEWNVGLFGDPTSKALAYTASRVTHWTIGGITLIDDLGPKSLAGKNK